MTRLYYQVAPTTHDNGEVTVDIVLYRPDGEQWESKQIATGATIREASDILSLRLHLGDDQ